MVAYCEIMAAAGEASVQAAAPGGTRPRPELLRSPARRGGLTAPSAPQPCQECAAHHLTRGNWEAVCCSYLTNLELFLSVVLPINFLSFLRPYQVLHITHQKHFG